MLNPPPQWFKSGFLITLLLLFFTAGKAHAIRVKAKEPPPNFAEFLRTIRGNPEVTGTMGAFLGKLFLQTQNGGKIASEVIKLAYPNVTLELFSPPIPQKGITLDKNGRFTHPDLFTPNFSSNYPTGEFAIINKPGSYSLVISLGKNSYQTLFPTSQGIISPLILEQGKGFDKVIELLLKIRPDSLESPPRKGDIAPPEDEIEEEPPPPEIK